jgi:hypothetical protein
MQRLPCVAVTVRDTVHLYSFFTALGPHAMRYTVHHARQGGFFVIDRRCPLHPVLACRQLGQALGFALRMSFRSVWGW